MKLQSDISSIEKDVSAIIEASDGGVKRTAEAVRDKLQELKG